MNRKSRWLGCRRRNLAKILFFCLLLAFAGYIWHGGHPQTALSSSARAEHCQALPSRQHGPIERNRGNDAFSENPEASAAVSPGSHPSDQGKHAAVYRLARLFDGDSFELADSAGRKLNVRLYGIDAPGRKQNFGEASSRHLLSLMKGHTFCMQVFSRDQYNRHVAVVYRVENGKIDDISLNQHQIRSGMAWVYDHFCTGNFCKAWKKEETLARRQRLGLWKDASPVPPWKWRRAHKSSR